MEFFACIMRCIFLIFKAQREIVNSALDKLDGNSPETFLDQFLSGNKVSVSLALFLTSININPFIIL